MRFTVKVVALVIMLLALLVPLSSYAQDAVCPDDPEGSATCDEEVPPFYVVINRDFEALDRPATGCQPIILDFPECTDCCGQDEDCLAAEDYLQTEVCPDLAAEVDWTVTDSEIVYQLCCDCSTEDDMWMYRVRLLREDGTCDIDPDNNGCYEGLPPGTGIELPAPLVVGGLAVLGAVVLGTGLVLRRRSSIQAV